MDDKTRYDGEFFHFIARDGSQWIARVATFDDLDELVVLDETSKPTPWGRDGMAEYIGRVPGVIVLCPIRNHELNHDTPVAFAIGQWLDDELEILSVAVHRDWRRRGFGMMLMKAMRAIAKAHDKVSWLLEVRETNNAARSLYERFGFEVVGERQGYYRDTGESAILMRGVL